MAEIKKWSMDGIVLECGDGGPQRSGTVTQEDLRAFLEAAGKQYPGAPVIVHAFGLRVVRVEDEKGCGPRLDWRDWD